VDKAGCVELLTITSAVLVAVIVEELLLSV
jgi:hypothetical protein